MSWNVTLHRWLYVLAKNNRSLAYRYVLRLWHRLFMLKTFTRFKSWFDVIFCISNQSFTQLNRKAQTVHWVLSFLSYDWKYVLLDHTWSPFLLVTCRLVQIQIRPGVSTSPTRGTTLCSLQSRGCRWEWISWRTSCQVTDKHRKTLYQSVFISLIIIKW